MRSSCEWYQVTQTISQHFPHLRPAQQDGLALWVYGTILAGSACEHAVLTALCILCCGWHTLRQRLREWLKDGQAKAAPCHTQVEVQACFGPLLRWLLAWWHGAHLAVAVDVTAHGDHVVALVVSVLYRGCALPVAWHILPANRAGAWVPHFLRLLRLLAPAIPRALPVLVLADRGLWSPRLWTRIRRLGWHPLLRVQEAITFQPHGQPRQAVRRLVPGPGHAWVGAGVAFRRPKLRKRGTLLVVWAAGQDAPWVVVTDLAPAQVGVAWYGLRIWIELGFRALKGVGWQWQRTRRTQPARVARHWLVLAVAMLLVQATGTRAEDAALAGLPPADVATPPASTAHPGRRVSVFRLGLAWLQHLLHRQEWWQSLWLVPEPWPAPPPNLQLAYHGNT